MTDEINYNGICPTCGKPYLYIGEVPPGGFLKGTEPWCTCLYSWTPNFNITTTGIVIQYGWVCPLCGKGVNPNEKTCPCKP